MHAVFAGALFLLLSSSGTVPARAQSSAGAEQPHSEFFSGIVTALSADKITVVRTVLGKNSDMRTFSITPATRVEGKLRLKVRVTVRYVKDEDGDRALHIIVRISQKK